MQDWQSKIDEIMDQFDFGRVAKTIEALQWKWAGIPDEVPCESEIRESARSKLRYVANYGRDITISSGGFEAERFGDDLALRFIVEEWDTHNG